MADCAPILEDVRKKSLQHLDSARRSDVECSPVGVFAYKLRQYMCAGEEPALLRYDMMEKIYAAFGSLGADSDVRNLMTYKNWVKKLATREYADELVVVACALEFRVRIVCIPYTPVGQPSPWKTSSYQPPGPQLHDDKTVFLGNNDVHYMWLRHS